MRCAFMAALLAAWLLPEPVTADSIESGHIITIEDREIYFSIGRSRGIRAGDSLRIKRPIKLKHPVTGKLVSDWLPMGTARVTAVGESMAMAVVRSDLLSQVKIGDIVEMLVLSPEPDLPAIEQPRQPEFELPAIDPASLPQVDAHTQAVLAVWRATSGKSLEVRIGAWEEFLVKHPKSPYVAAIHQDLEVLRTLREELRPAELSLDERGAGRLHHNPPTRGRPGQPIGLVFLIDAPDLAAAWIHYRVRGSPSYSKAVLTREGDDYLRGEIPGLSVKGPGVEYFVEIATRRGTVGTAVGSPERPLLVDVPSPPITSVFDNQRQRSRVTLTTTYLDFATFDARSGTRTDAFYLVEADFFYRLRKTPYGVRTGFGVINGSGGFANRDYDASRPAPKAGFNFGYLELEFRGDHNTAASGRLVAGVGQDGFGLGFEGRFRLGREDGTNLSLGASSLAEVGFLTDLRMQWDAMKDFPLGLAVALTNQPTQGDLGVRLTTDIGYRALPWVQPTLRVSYQARTVIHSGIGAGLGLVFDW